MTAVVYSYGLCLAPCALRLVPFHISHPKLRKEVVRLKKSDNPDQDVHDTNPG
jgi:hypothetical protein